MYFCYLVIIWPWILKISIAKGCFVLSLVEIGPVIIEKKIFKDFVKVISLFCNYLPLKKGRAINLNKLLIPKWCIVSSLFEISPVILIDWLIDWLIIWCSRRIGNILAEDEKRQIVIRKAHLSLWLSWAKAQCQFNDTSNTLYHTIYNEKCLNPYIYILSHS